MRKVWGGVIAAGLLLLPAGARADNICAPSDPAGFYACASVDISWDNDDSFIVLKVRNTDAWDPTFTTAYGYRLVGVGINGDPSIASYLAATGHTVGIEGPVGILGTPLDQWEFTTSLSGDLAVQAGSASSPGNNGAIIGCTMAGAQDYLQTCTPGGYVVFNFKMEGFSQAMFDAVAWDYSLRGIAGPDGVSFKCADGSDRDCIPTETVPEPISMVLLGTGLLGVGGVARRRRKNNLEA